MRKIILNIISIFILLITYNSINAGWRGRSFGYGIAGGLLGSLIGNALTAPRYNDRYQNNYPYYQHPEYEAEYYNH